MILLHRILASLRRRVHESDMDEELRFHLDMETAENVRRGMTAEEARRAAHRAFGGVESTKEAWRDLRFLTRAEACMRDLRYGLRSLARTPGFTFFAVLMLALGIGANTAIFSALHALVLRPLPYGAPERLATICETSTFQGQSAWMSASVPNLLDWRRQNQLLEGIGAYSSAGVNLALEADTQHVAAARVEPDTFRILQARPQLGRIFLPGENEAGRDRVAILSHGLWQRQFAADPDVIGRQISIDGATHTVIGVMPRTFQFPPRTDTQLWTPLSFDDRSRSARGSHWLGVIARLKPGVLWRAAQADLDGVARRISQQYGRTDGVLVQPLHGEAVRAVTGMLGVLSAAVGFVLLLACANVSNLILTRAAGQRRELALRAALGAGRWRIVRLLLAESLSVAVIGGAVGLWAAKVSLGALVAAAGSQLPAGVPISLDGATVWFCALVTLVSALLAGLTPALRTSQVELVTTLKDAGASAGATGRRRPSLLLVCEIAVTLTLVIGATLLVRSLRALSHADLGFRPERVLTMRVALPRARYQTGAQTQAFYDQLISDLSLLPGVSRAAAITLLPVESADNRFVFSIAGREPAAPGSEPGALVRIASTAYFDAIGLPLLRGRGFQEDDGRSGGPVVVINRRVAQQYFPDQDPVGQSIALGVGDGRDAWMTVVGVVGNHWNGGPNDPVPAIVYTPLRQFPWPLAAMSVIARTSVEPESITEAARQIVRKRDRDAAVFEAQTMTKIISDSTADTRLLSRLLTLFAALAMALAVIGVYSVMSYQASRRTHEVGIRMALGASRRQVLAEMLGRGLINSLAGAALGSACAIVTSRGLQAYVIGVPLVDSRTYLISALMIVFVALLASFLPALRASRVDPAIALRNE